VIPLSVPNLKGNEMKYVADAVEHGWVSTAGSYVTRFEKEMAAYLKVKGTTALQSGTAAIHLALRLSDVSLGDEVIVPTLTFIAAVNPVRYLGAEPVFMDCDDSLTIDCDKLEDFLKHACIRTADGLQNKLTKRRIKAIVVVHVFGNMADMECLSELASQYQIKLIEDATESLGTYCKEGKQKEKFTGTIGDFGAYSFNGNKIKTTGGGGMLTAKDENNLWKARYFATQAKDDSLYYIHNEIGYNYRMTNLQAALGVAQLERLEEFIEIKEKNYRYYEDAIEKIDGFELLKLNDKARNNYWFYSLLIKKSDYDKTALINQFKEKEIETRPIWQLNHLQRMYLNNQSYYIEKALYYWRNVINLPCSTNLTANDVDSIIQVLERYSGMK
jgi:perosamine synthetase